MASWVLLLLASVLLGSPGSSRPGTGVPASSEGSAEGLAFSSLSPEDYDPAMASLCEGQQLRQGLAREGPQGDLLTATEGRGTSCWLCRRMMQELENRVGKQPKEHPGTAGPTLRPGYSDLPFSSGMAVKGHHRPGCVPAVQKDEAAEWPLQEDHEEISSTHHPGHHGWQKAPRNLCGHPHVQISGRSHVSLWGLWPHPGEKAQELQRSRPLLPS